MRLSNEQINTMAAEVLGIEWCPGSWNIPNGVELCEHSTGDADEYKRLHPRFCTDLNAAQRLVKEVGRSRRGRYELSGAVGYLLFGERDYPSDTDIADALLLPAKTITLAALVAAGKISIEDAKESI